MQLVKHGDFHTAATGARNSKSHKYWKRLLITTPIAITPYKMRISSPSLPTMTISPRKSLRNRSRRRDL